MFIEKIKITKFREVQDNKYNLPSIKTKQNLNLGNYVVN